MYIKDQLRHPASRTEQVLHSWTFGYETAIVGLVRPQPVSLYLYLMIIQIYILSYYHSISPVSLICMI